MIKLPILKMKDKDSLAKIIQSKRMPARGILKNIETAICKDYYTYLYKRHQLETMVPDSLIGAGEKKLLNDAYKSGKEIDLVKAKIINNMPSAIKEKCPYCMLSEPGTYDHYLGKGEFPEFSVFSKNLIPCCSKCNGLKGEKFLSKNGKRMFISFYFDPLPPNPFLIVDVDIDKNVPYIKKIHIESTTGDCIDDVIKTHFKELNLFDRYRDAMSNRLSVLVDKLGVGEYSRLELISVLEREVYSLEKMYGKHYWECCLYRGIMDSDAVIDYLCKTE